VSAGWAAIRKDRTATIDHRVLDRGPTCRPSIESNDGSCFRDAVSSFYDGSDSHIVGITGRRLMAESIMTPAFGRNRKIIDN
jgi:hypothetical protein